jgi:iron(III) transport system ATP-binding protein
MNVLELDRLAKQFGSFKAVDSLSLSVRHGEFLSVLGPSGCGKSTLLRMIAGIEQPTAGTIKLMNAVVSDVEMGKVVPPEKRNLGMVFQSYALWPHLTVLDNIAFPLKCRGVAKVERVRAASAMLQKVGLDSLGQRYPGELSGGQQQRVGLARALVSKPSLLLLDEPLSNLDARLREELRTAITQIVRDEGTAAIYVTHDQTEALSMSDRVLVMRRGCAIQCGTPEDLYRMPASFEVAEFMGFRTVLDGELSDTNTAVIDGLSVNVSVPEKIAVGTPVKIAIRPTAVKPADSPNSSAPKFSVVAVRFMGKSYEFDLRFNDTLVTAESNIPFAQRGDLVPIVFEQSGCFAYRREQGR